MYFLGIDGGGTRTTASVCREDRSELLRVTGDTINYRAVGPEAAGRNMKKILDEIEDKSGVTRFDSVFIGMSALSDEATEQELNAFCGGLFRTDHLHMNSDLYIALAACEGKTPLAAICGTGSMAAARRSGRVITKGGYGHLLGDEGSAFAIAQQAIKTAVRAGEGSQAPTALTGALLRFYRAASLADLLTVFYDPPMQKKEIAAFAAAVTDCARDGDETALGILKEQAELFASTVRALASELEDKPTIRFSGGVFRHDEIFTRFFTDAVSDICEDAAPMKKEPVEGAVLCAAAYCGTNGGNGK